MNIRFKENSNSSQESLFIKMLQNGPSLNPDQKEELKRELNDNQALNNKLENEYPDLEAMLFLEKVIQKKYSEKSKEEIINLLTDMINSKVLYEQHCRIIQYGIILIYLLTGKSFADINLEREEDCSILRKIFQDKFLRAIAFLGDALRSRTIPDLTGGKITSLYLSKLAQKAYDIFFLCYKEESQFFEDVNTCFWAKVRMRCGKFLLSKSYLAQDLTQSEILYEKAKQQFKELEKLFDISGNQNLYFFLDNQNDFVKYYGLCLCRHYLSETEPEKKKAYLKETYDFLKKWFLINPTMIDPLLVPFNKIAPAYYADGVPATEIDFFDAFMAHAINDIINFVEYFNLLDRLVTAHVENKQPPISPAMYEVLQKILKNHSSLDLEHEEKFFSFLVEYAPDIFNQQLESGTKELDLPEREKALLLRRICNLQTGALRQLVLLLMLLTENFFENLKKQWGFSTQEIESALLNDIQQQNACLIDNFTIKKIFSTMNATEKETFQQECPALYKQLLKEGKIQFTSSYNVQGGERDIRISSWNPFGFLYRQQEEYKKKIIQEEMNRATGRRLGNANKKDNGL